VIAWASAELIFLACDALLIPDGRAANVAAASMSTNLLANGTA
jgi:hypothetical protein